VDVREAARLYDLALAQGNTVAGYNLGKLYEKGEGVPVDHARAAQLYLGAAGQV
jgi:TPR repeat protein